MRIVIVGLGVIGGGYAMALKLSSPLSFKENRMFSTLTLN